MIESLANTVSALLSEGKGILAADESPKTIGKRFNKIGIQSTKENRILYRKILFSTIEPMKNFISGVILHDEVIRYKDINNCSLLNILKETNTIPGIKVDHGIINIPFFPKEFVTEGIDGLEIRLKEYLNFGVRFAKWRGVISINNTDLPTSYSVKQNAYILARYASICQNIGIVPIIEPEVLMDGIPGNHSINRCYQVTKYVLGEVFYALRESKVNLNYIILKTNMIIDGKNSRLASIDEVADKTINCLKETVPISVPGIAFLSGGQSEQEATDHLSAISIRSKSLPWKITFSYGRALQASALYAWDGKNKNILLCQNIFANRCKMNYHACNI